jgi:hypothetical protein
MMIDVVVVDVTAVDLCRLLREKMIQLTFVGDISSINTRKSKGAAQNVDFCLQRA